MKEIGEGGPAADLRIVERLIDEVGLDPALSTFSRLCREDHDGFLPDTTILKKLTQLEEKSDNRCPEALESGNLRSQYEKTRDGKPARTSQKSAKPDIKLDWFEDYLKSIE